MSGNPTVDAATGNSIETGVEDSASTRINVKRLYPGAASFRDTQEDRVLFFGREQERTELLHLVLSESLVVLFGKSGLGKSSLINVHLMRDLRKNRYFPISVRVKADVDATPTASVINCIYAAVARTQQPRETRVIDDDDQQPVVIEGDPDETNLWRFFQSTSFRSAERTLRPVLVIDQFEELFTTYPRSDASRADFIQSFADLVRRRVPDQVRAEASAQLDRLPETAGEARAKLLRLLYEDAVPDVKVVIAIREDYLPELHSMRVAIPSIMRNALRLDPLSRDQARLAIEGPTKHAIAGGRPL